jgi:hypothetical protein
MRHQWTTRFVLLTGGLLVIAAALFALARNP